MSFKTSDAIKAGKRPGRHYSFPPESAVVNSTSASDKCNHAAMQCEVAQIPALAGTYDRDQLELFGVAS